MGLQENERGYLVGVEGGSGVVGVMGNACNITEKSQGTTQP